MLAPPVTRTRLRLFACFTSLCHAPSALYTPMEAHRKMFDRPWDCGGVAQENFFARLFARVVTLVALGREKANSCYGGE